ncbi:Bile acid-coenzyme A ligase [Clavibacter michiganensis]|uniref:Bile acid-coenzyme A ligase n=1 Tax=Clavibacter michiganensis TaxID=28447 RepID=A0A251Y9I0_9MICO|nr:AMP-binding protein [Clavibacter michiganensis]OUE20729.1 Bile acid-coenzyme A ligase [Clavibacter michiganensis]
MARQSISRIISGLADADPDRVVVRDDAGTLTARELDRASNRLARAYLSMGVGQDDRVAIALPNTREMVVVCAAVWKAGATPQPMSTGLSAEERAHVEDLARPALVVGAVSTRKGVPSVPAGWSPQSELDDGQLPDAWARSWKAPTSSGSTGRPKVVATTAPALLDPTLPVAPYLPLDQVQLVTAPLTHSAAFTYAFRGLMTGHALVLLPRFDERRVLAAIAEHRITWTLLVPTMLHRLLRLPDAERRAADLSTLRTVLHLGAPCPPGVKRAFMDWIGPERLVEVYAGSESNGILTIRGDEWLRHPGSVGRPAAGTAVSIRSAEGRELPAGEVGRIWMRRDGGPAYAYVGAGSARTADGWDTLGDLGRVDADGYVSVLDRADDVILRGGVNVHPAEVERVLEQHPAVRGAVAFGVPDDDLGQRVEAVVDVADAQVDAAELLAWARARLDAERRPAAVRLTRTPVRDDAGKTRRRAYARAAVEGRD